MNRILLSLAAALIAMSAAAVDLSDEQRAAIEERIKPVGEACIEGDAKCATTAAPAGSSDDAAASRSGEEVYNAACLACHMTGAGGAPLLGDAAAWGDRIAKGMDALYDSGINGVAGTGMIAKGGCMNCSDDEVRAAVDFIVEKSQ